jgi:hypothetical protein
MVIFVNISISEIVRFANSLKHQSKGFTFYQCLVGEKTEGPGVDLSKVIGTLQALVNPWQLDQVQSIRL